ALLGTNRAELLGKRLCEAHPARARAPLEEGCRRAMAEHIVVRLDHYDEPSSRWYAITSMPDSSGGTMVQFSDITALKLIEGALRKSEEKWSKAFHLNPLPMCIVDVDRNAYFLDVNEAFESMSGYRRDEVIGRTSTELGLYNNLADLKESRRLLLENGGY